MLACQSGLKIYSGLTKMSLTIEETLAAIQASINETEPSVEPWVPAENAIVSDAVAEEAVAREAEVIAAVEGKEPTGFKFPAVKVKERFVDLPTPAPTNVSMGPLMKAVQKESERDAKQRQGITRSVMEGLTFDVFDEASALLSSIEEGIPYDIARRRYNLEQGEFERLNPNLSSALEIGASLPSSVAGFGALQAGAKAANKLNQTRKAKQFTSGKKPVEYTAANGNVSSVNVVEDMGDYVKVKGADGKVRKVKKSRITVDPADLELGVTSNMTLGAIEGAGWGFTSGKDGDRATSAVIGGVAGLAMGKAIDFFQAPNFKSSTADAADESLMISGIEYPNVVETIRAQSSKALGEAQDANANPQLDDGVAAMFGQPAPNAPAPFSYIDQFTQSPTAKTEKRGGIGGAWDSLVEGYQNVAMGLSDKITWSFSPQWGSRIQRGDETALRSLSKEMPEFVDPVTPVLDLEINDLAFRGLMLDFAKGVATIDEVKAYISRELGEGMANAAERHIKWAEIKNNGHIKAISGKDFGEQSYLSTKITAKKRAEKGDAERDFDFPDDPGLLSRTRGNYKDGAVNPEDYMPVLATNLRRIMNNERMVQYAQKMGMPTVRNMKTPDDFFEAMQRHIIDMGLDPDLAMRGTKLIKDNLIGQTRSPNQWIQALNSYGYATTLAGPMSALLNLHDPMVASVKYGLRNTLKGLAQPSYDVRSRGVDQNVGEFMNKVVDLYSGDKASLDKAVAEVARNGTDWLMKGSGFQAMDNMGKSGTIKAILNNAAELAAKDSKTVWKKGEQYTKGQLARAWGFYFDKAELDMIQRELMKHGADFAKYSGKAAELLEELGFAGLGQQQLISGAGRPNAWARHPNLRPMWALRGFAIKQQSLLMREIVFNIKAGRTDEAMKFMLRYIALAGGSFGLLNEARQWVFGDGEATLPGIIQGAADQVVSTMTLNTIGLNDYQYGRLMQDGLPSVLAEAAVPLPASRIYDQAKSAWKGMTDPNASLLTETINEIPALRQPFNALQNLGENTDFVSEPLRNLEASIRPGEQR
jgi:hypothetical protein